MLFLTVMLWRPDSLLLIPGLALFLLVMAGFSVVVNVFRFKRFLRRSMTEFV